MLYLQVRSGTRHKAGFKARNFWHAGKSGVAIVDA